MQPDGTMAIVYGAAVVPRRSSALHAESDRRRDRIGLGSAQAAEEIIDMPVEG